METTFAPNNLRISLLCLIRNILRSVFTEKIQLNIIEKLRKFSGGGNPRLWCGKGFSIPKEAPPEPLCFPLPGSSSLQRCSSPSQLEGPRGFGKTACSTVASLARHFDQPWGKGAQQCPALGGQLTLPFSPPSLLLLFSGQVMSDSWWPHGLQPTRLLCPWDSPGKNTGVGCHSLLQGIFPTQGSNSSLLLWQVDSLPLSHQVNLTISGALVIIMRCRP